MPSYRDYWSERLRYEPIANVMSLKRYETLRRFIHFVNNEEVNDDPYFKIRPVLEKIRQNCLGVEQENRCSIDEMMIPYKGIKAGSKRQYIKNKPTKWGFKMYVRAGISGIIYDFLLYGGDQTFRNYTFENEEGQLGFGAKVVIALCKSLSNPPGTFVYFDNFFSSFELMSYLRNELGIFSLGTIRSNRLRGCELLNDKQLRKNGRGSYDYKVDNENRVFILKWYDNKPVLLSSTYVSDEPVSEISRYSNEKKQRVSIPCPKIVKDYNQHMGGVDLADMLIALYRTGLKSRKWYMNIFSQLIDICVNNAWLMSRRDHQLLKINEKHPTLKHLRHSIAKSLQLKSRCKRGRPSNVSKPQVKRNPKIPKPIEDVRYDCIDHFPIFGARGRCKLCPKSQTNVTCTKCNVRLCFTEKRNCFLTFHK